MTPEQQKLFAFRLRLEQERSGEKPAISKTESAIRGGAQGLSLGFSDEMEAALRSAFSPEEYTAIRDRIRSKYKAAQEANPMTYGVGELGGAAAPAIAATLLSGGTAAPAAGAGLSATAARMLAPATIRGAAALGGAAGLGYGESDLARGDVLGTAKDVGTGAAVGGGIGTAARGLGGIAKALPKLGQQTSELSAFHGLGLRGAPLEKMGVSGGRKIAATALEGQKALGGKSIMTPFSNTTRMLQNANAVNESAGQRIGIILKQLDDAGVQGPNVGNLRGQLEQLMGEIREVAPNMGAGAIKQYEMALADIANLGDRPSFTQLGRLKKAIGDLTYKHGSALESKGGLQDAYNVVRNELDNAVELGTAKIHKPGLSQQYQKAKNVYHDTDIMIESLNKKNIRETGNNFFNLTSVGGAGIGSFVGGLPGMIAGGMAVKGAQAYGPQIAARSTRWIGGQLAKIVAENPSMLGKYAQTLAQAARRGSQQLAAAHFVLQQNDPEYRKLMEQIDERGNQQAD